MKAIRRVPRQERSQRRLDAILTAAAERFADPGFEATTMESIAEAAETSIGSLYQFFPNKRALFRAVAERCLARASEYYLALLGPAPHTRHWTELLDGFVDGFFAFQAKDPFFRAVVTNIELYGEFAEADEAMLRGFAGTTERLLLVWAPALAADRRRVVATMIVEVIAAMLVVSNRQPAELARSMIAETKTMLRRYLEPLLA